MSLQEQDYWQGNVHVAKQVDVVRVCYVMNDKGSRYKFLVLVALMLVALMLVALVLVALMLVALVLVALMLVRFLASLDCSVLTAGIQMIAVVLSR